MQNLLVLSLMLMCLYASMLSVSEAHSFPDVGSLSFQIFPGRAGPGSVVLLNEENCNGEARIYWSWDKNNNFVNITGVFTGLPYRPNVTRISNPNTPYNKFPPSVTNGQWRALLVGRLFNFEVPLVYETATNNMLGAAPSFPVEAAIAQSPTGPFQFNRYKIVPSPPIDLSFYNVPGVNILPGGIHDLIGPFFETDPNTGIARFEWILNYNQLLDDEGTAGFYFGNVPFNLCEPSEVTAWYTQGGLPPSAAMNWDNVLDTVEGPLGASFAVALHENPQWDYILGRDNPMIAFLGSVPENPPIQFPFVTGSFDFSTVCPSDPTKIKNIENPIQGPRGGRAGPCNVNQEDGPTPVLCRNNRWRTQPHPCTCEASCLDCLLS